MKENIDDIYIEPIRSINEKIIKFKPSLENFPELIGRTPDRVTISVNLRSGKPSSIPYQDRSRLELFASEADTVVIDDLFGNATYRKTEDVAITRDPTKIYLYDSADPIRILVYELVKRFKGGI